MKTGRVRIKDKTAPEQKPAPPTPRPTPRPAAAKPAAPAAAAQAPKSRFNPAWILGGLFACITLFALVGTALSGRGRAEQWVRAERDDGAWTATVTVLGPQVVRVGRWESECSADPNCAILPGTCVMSDTQTLRETPVEEYDEYAYDIYYEETWQQVYEAQGTEFVATQLGSDDWWEGDTHSRRVETLDRKSCEYGEYTVWVNDPDSATQEIEVYLAECQVWDHVTVTRRGYEQKRWCQAHITTLAKIGEESGQGSGPDVRWPQPAVPPGGRAEQTFGGQVTFRADDQTFTVSTTDVAEYQGYLSRPYYLGFRDGQPVGVSASPPK